jgi:hypothetical protein
MSRLALIEFNAAAINVKALGIRKKIMPIRRLFGLAAAATLLLSAGAFLDSPGQCGSARASWWPSSLAHAKDLTKMFEAEKEACFGRVYDQAHLKAHPQQKVTSIHVFRSLDDRKEAENWTPARRQERIDMLKSENPSVGVDAYVTFRDRKGYFYNSLSCSDSSDEGVMCGIDCDGGSFVLKPGNAGSIMLQNNGFVLIGGCGEDIEQADQVYFTPGKDDKVFRLDKKPADVCRAEEQKTTPIRLGQGQPLRERFKPDEPFCYGRDYDAAHMAKHPQQKVASIRVGRLDTAQERKETATMSASEWPGDVRVNVAMKMKAGAARNANYSCDPEVSNWKCHITGPETHNDTCTERYFNLSRAPGENISLINRRDGLPIDFTCPNTSKSQNAGDDMDKRKTKSDDASFRLTKMPLEACR